MKTRNTLLISLFVLTSLFLTGCKKDIEVPNDQCKEVIGEWVWSYSTGGFALAIKSPDSEGYQQKVEFDKNGKYTLYRDNKKIGSSNYEFKIGSSIYVSGNEYLIYYNKATKHIKGITHSFEFADENTLVLSEQCYDCYSHVYVKK